MSACWAFLNMLLAENIDSLRFVLIAFERDLVIAIQVD